MKSAICTLFEGSYHLGVGALVNSLCKYGFTGTVFAGYRGNLPEWVAQLPAIPNAAGQNVRKVTEEVSLAFLPLPGTRHLANLKADFMLQVLDELSPEADQVFYFDPDVVCIGPWSFFEQWVQEGVAIVIDGNFPMPQRHPVRRAWHRYFEAHGMQFGGTAQDYYFNSGFLGVARADKNFLHDWKRIHDLIEPEGVLTLPIGLAGAPASKQHRSYPFWLPDQDALNVAADLEGANISPIGSEAMGWKQPYHFLLHACGSPKPWVDTVLREAIRGKSPEAIMFFRFLEFFAGPIPVMPPEEIRRRKNHVRIAGAIAPLCGALQWLKRNQ